MKITHVIRCAKFHAASNSSETPLRELVRDRILTASEIQAMFHNGCPEYPPDPDMNVVQIKITATYTPQNDMNLINETHLGTDATEADARRLAEILTAAGYPSEYTAAQGPTATIDVPDDIWFAAVEKLAARRPEDAKIAVCLNDQYTGHHRVTGLRTTMTVRDWLAKAEESDHWHDLPDEERQTVARLLAFHADYVWTGGESTVADA